MFKPSVSLSMSPIGVNRVDVAHEIDEDSTFLPFPPGFGSKTMTKENGVRCSNSKISVSFPPGFEPH